MAAANPDQLDYFRRNEPTPNLVKKVAGSFDYFRRNEPNWTEGGGTWVGLSFGVPTLATMGMGQ